MEKVEIKFWRAKASKGLLMDAIRLEHDRAILFFGRKNVEREDEGHMMYVLDAYEIINASEQELVSKIKKMPRLSCQDIANLPTPVRERVLALEKPIREQAHEMRVYARQVMRRMKM
jgi:hypothetical protein